MQEKIVLFWFRRDLRIDDNIGLHHALNESYPVLPIFIFDDDILNELNISDPRVNFIYDRLKQLSNELANQSSSIACFRGTVAACWSTILENYNVHAVYANEDYEPFAIERDDEVRKLLNSNGIKFHLFKDQVIHAKREVVKNDNTPYTVFTPYKKKWLELLYSDKSVLASVENKTTNFARIQIPFPSLSDIGFERSNIKVLDYNLTNLENYSQNRDFPGLNMTSNLSPHLRFGTVSIRKIVATSLNNDSFLSELIWREFFMQILFHYPKNTISNFKSNYNDIKWRNEPSEFEKWKNGLTGYPLVDAGMRELNTTGYMHNRVRMVVASFLCKHLLIDWRLGEAYFAEKLLDYELASNNGNWQWSAGTGCDAAPYFRIFNPTEQAKKFDPHLVYIKKWIPELDSLDYPLPMVDHKFARQRAIETYKNGII